MKKLLLAAVALFAVTAPAQAVTLLSDNFDAEADGTPQPNLTNFNVTAGTVDIVSNGGFGIACAGGSCLDLEGSPGNGTIVTKATYALVSGLKYTISFVASGNQRGGGPDSFVAGFLFGDSTSANFTGPALAANAGYAPYSFSFKAVDAGTFQAYVGGTGPLDNRGVVIDNFALTASVPEPATWALMILGFGLVGGAMRRAKPRVNVAFA